MMPTEILLDELQRMLAANAQLVEVLPHNDYEKKHIPRAISLPLGEIDAKSAAGLRRDRPLVVYCYDYQ